MTPLKTKDSRPLQVCYICSASLHNCYMLRTSCRRSEELLTQMLHSNTLESVKRQDAPTTTGRLRVTAVVHFSMGGVPEGNSAADVKAESPEVFVDVVVKREDAEGVQDCPPKENGAHSVGSDDDLPLDIVKNELQVDTSVSPRNEEPLAVTSSSLSNGVQAAVKVEHMIGDDKPFYFQCRACKKSFYERRRLNAHACPHADKKPYKCDVCDKRFQLKCRLMFHARKHCEEEPYRCSLCDKTFDKRYRLNYHVRAHTGEKPYQCEVCEKRFITKNYLSKHGRMHSSERPFECDVCSKTFKLKSNLVTHVRRHSDERPFRCHVCNKGFNYNGNLKKHIQIHTGERPHACEACGKRFINNSDLVKHRRTHSRSGEKPFRCERCHETFNYNSNFLKHKRERCRLSRTD
ncbi:unnamed protein product [Arctia plantaginis]|uniref:C2H2-type domain-containing protein n=1 Tax=Arctia plantaginis TaxID=874455 RepID=A0A8S1ABJ5_ARCPL|nr:unnamed protein product [Arctia plantaginis]